MKYMYDNRFYYSSSFILVFAFNQERVSYKLPKDSLEYDLTGILSKNGDSREI